MFRNGIFCPGFNLGQQPYRPRTTGAAPDWVGHWLFDEGSGTTANDSGPNNHDGTLTGAGVAFITGAVSFDGSGGYVDVGEVDVASDSFRFTGYLTAPATLADTYGCIFVKGKTAGEAGWEILTTGTGGGGTYGALSVFLEPSYSVQGSTVVCDATEHKVDLVVDRALDTATIYVDDVEDVSVSIVGLGSLTDVRYPGSFGQLVFGGYWRLNGDLRDCQLSEL